MAEPEVLNGLALCAGAGGLELGVGLAEPGLRTVCYVEREAYAAACLVARMEDASLERAPVWDDLHTFDGRRWRGCVDIVTSGDPCQGNSVAGRRLGKDDERFLADQVLRIFQESGADRLFRENVPGNADGQIAAFVPALERMGCRVAVGIFSARGVGASHRRERLFILADRNGGFGDGSENEIRPRRETAGSGGGDVADRAGGGGRRLSARSRAEGQGTPDLDGRGPAMADADCGGSENVGSLPAQGRQPDASDGGIPIFPPGPGDLDGWAEVLEIAPHLEPAVRRMADGLAHRVDRLRLCGNGVVPLEAAYAYATLGALLAAAAGTGELVVRAAE